MINPEVLASNMNTVGKTATILTSFDVNESASSGVEGQPAEQSSVVQYYKTNNTR